MARRSVVDDGNVLLVVAGFESALAAPAFRDNPELGAKMKEAGVGATPRVEL